MNNNFKQLLERFTDEWETVVNATSLHELEDTFLRCEETRTDILNWVFENLEDEEEQGEYFSTFGKLESNLLDTVGDIPVFDEKFDIYASFEEYEAYYQRFGCMTPEFVISWDRDSVLWTDEETIEIVKRPDVLMTEND